MDVHRGRWVTVRVTRGAAPSLVSNRIAVAALIGLALVQLWIAFAGFLRLELVGGVLDQNPHQDLDQNTAASLTILRPFTTSALAGFGAVALGLGIAAAAALVWRFGYRARWAALGLVGVAVAFQAMAALIGLSRASNRSIAAGQSTSDALPILVITPAGVQFGPPVGSGVPDATYDEVTAAVAGLGRVDLAVGVVTAVLAILAVIALRPAVAEARPATTVRASTYRHPSGPLGWRPILASVALVGLAAVFATIAFGTVRRLSTAYEVARGWGLGGFETDELARRFGRSAFLVGAPSLVLAGAAVTVALLVVRRRPRSVVAATIVGAVGGLVLLTGLAVGLVTDRAPGRLTPPPPTHVLGWDLGGWLQLGHAYASPADELTSRLLPLSTMDTTGQVLGLLAIALVAGAMLIGRSP